MAHGELAWLFHGPHMCLKTIWICYCHALEKECLAETAKAHLGPAWFFDLKHRLRGIAELDKECAAHRCIFFCFQRDSISVWEVRANRRGPAMNSKWEEKEERRRRVEKEGIPQKSVLNDFSYTLYGRPTGWGLHYCWWHDRTSFHSVPSQFLSAYFRPKLSRNLVRISYARWDVVATLELRAEETFEKLCYRLSSPTDLSHREWNSLLWLSTQGRSQLRIRTSPTQCWLWFSPHTKSQYGWKRI